VSPLGLQVDASVVGPVACRLAECSELVGVLASATVVGELCDGVAELSGVDGVAAGPPSPQVEGFDLSSQDRDLVAGVAEPSPGVVAIEGRLCLLEACSR
jgi:hypothetical protein